MNLFRRITDICGAGNNGSWKYAPCGASPNCVISIKGPDNPTCQLLPIMSNKSCSGTGKEGKTKEVVKDREVKNSCVGLWDKVVCERWCVTKKDGMYVRPYVLTYACMYVCMYIRMYVCM